MTSWTMDPRKLPNGTVLFLGISYASARPRELDMRGLDMRGRTAPKIYTYAALKQAGAWFFSGSGKVPQDAGWGAVEHWLERDGRKLEWVKIVTALEDVYPAPLPSSPSVAGLELSASAMHTTDRDVVAVARLSLGPSEEVDTSQASE